MRAPLLFLPGGSGKLMYVIPLTVIIALSFSFLDALFFIPAHLKGVLKNNYRVKQKQLIKLDWVNKLTMFAIMKRKFVLPCVVVLIFSAAFVSYKSLSFLLYPTDGAYLIGVSAEADPDLAVDEIWQQTQMLETLFGDTAEVAYWYGDVSSPNSSWEISLTPPNGRTRTAEQIVAEWEMSLNMPSMVNASRVFLMERRRYFSAPP